MTKTIFRFVFFIVLAVVPVAPAVATGNIESGANLATRWCSTCHVVNAAQRQASADVPPFATIARGPNFSVDRIATFLLEPHPKMPNLGLSRSETDDIAAYIGSLVK
jgi:mono/diheme cytochrome c family protein